MAILDGHPTVNRVPQLVLAAAIVFHTPLAARELSLAERARAVLQQRCVRCHNSEKRRGGLDLSARSSLLEGGDNGPAIVPGNVKDSVLIQRLRAGSMPPINDGEPVEPSELKVLIDWIMDGAPDSLGRSGQGSAAEGPAAVRLAAVQRWLGPQVWQRDVDQPILSLGQSGEWDDTHIFAPAVAFENDKYLMWYCGSQGKAHDLARVRVPDERVFRLGMASSEDGKRFSKNPPGAVFQMAEPKMSIVTPTILRDADGNIVRESGRIRMWFSSATLAGGGPPQSIRETSSVDGIRWSPESDVQIARAYAPTVIKSERGYEMWYSEPGRYPWNIKYAFSKDGRQWSVSERPVLEMTQDWEHFVMIYPTVLRVDGLYLMWYASYMTTDRETTGIGFAVSEDGKEWHKHPENPVLRPEPNRSWESHYVSSHSVMRLKDGSFRIWYASRKQPPFTNLYFALNTARWSRN